MPREDQMRTPSSERHDAADGDQEGVTPIVDLEREGLLDGLDGQERAERLVLLRRLLQDGVPVQELRRHAAEGTLVFLPAERVITGPKRYTAAEVSDLSGAELELLFSARRAMGLSVPGPDEDVYLEADIEVMRAASAARAAGMSEEEILELMRTLGRGLSQSAEVMRALAARLVLEPGIGEHDLAQRYVQVAQLAPLLVPLIANLLTLQLQQIAASEAISAAERAGGNLPGSLEVTVCFADLVGFTRLGEQLQPRQLVRLAVHLEELASDVCDPPVRLVKTIGDAAMLASVEPRPLIDATIALLDLADREGEQFPQLRAGIATGPALSRAGDWYGRPVNLASRITAIARPGSILTERKVRDYTRDAYRWSYAGERRFRGVREPVALYRVRRLSEGEHS